MAKCVGRFGNDLFRRWVTNWFDWQTNFDGYLRWLVTFVTRILEVAYLQLVEVLPVALGAELRGADLAVFHWKFLKSKLSNQADSIEGKKFQITNIDSNRVVPCDKSVYTIFVYK